MIFKYQRGLHIAAARSRAHSCILRFTCCITHLSLPSLTMWSLMKKQPLSL